MKKSNALPILGTAAIALIIGLAIGSVLLPTGKTETTTQFSTATVSTTQISTLAYFTNVSGQSYRVITITYQIVQVYPVIPYCTTISNKVTVVYSTGIGGSTTATYIFPTEFWYRLPYDKFYVTVVTASNGGPSFATQSVTDC